jgi:hypothetical protein
MNQAPIVRRHVPALRLVTDAQVLDQQGVLTDPGV